VDPHHLDADPDSTYHPDADPDTNPDSDFYLIWIHPEPDEDADADHNTDNHQLSKNAFYFVLGYGR
jgi:hypothetical protein